MEGLLTRLLELQQVLVRLLMLMLMVLVLLLMLLVLLLLMLVLLLILLMLLMVVLVMLMLLRVLVLELEVVAGRRRRWRRERYEWPPVPGPVIRSRGRGHESRYIVRTKREREWRTTGDSASDSTGEPGRYICGLLLLLLGPARTFRLAVLGLFRCIAALLGPATDVHEAEVAGHLPSGSPVRLS